MVPQLASKDDVPSIVAIFRTCFSDDYFHAVFPPTATGDAYLTQAFTYFIDPSQPGQIHVLKDESGLKSMLLWFTENGPEKTQGWRGRGWPAPYEGMSLDKIQEFYGAMDAQHDATMGGKKHVYIELIMTHPSARGQGHASKLVRHVASVADGRDVYLDAQGHAIGLYERLGFKVVEGIKMSELMTPMVRSCHE
ncbi:acyl-CoA N-acyltransferase [Emericellopsis atlantica]|uniref:Acyl-CoA N-acyltransferase n=1 Tax=Emericellopsis atlantica TaxID=2614577 RepID=A0A9P7ZQ62_9HYPO|nr:acyl-CoA N-acyltransferase [Emericellopsis atlantica]KAG9256294.1 acyl-CoA N-acyltransferase [Emericellopsis atlantica]